MRKSQAWVKFEDERPENWIYETFDEFWHQVREYMLKRPLGRIEWIIFE